MPYPRSFYRTVATLSRPRPQMAEAAPKRLELVQKDFDLDRPEEAFAALRRLVAQSRQGEQLTPVRKGPPHLRHLEVDAAQALAVYSRRRCA
jgi:hypothetical protein